MKKGQKMSEEQKKKIGLANSIALKGHVLSIETRKKMSLARKGKPTPWMFGRILSDETRLKLSNATKGRIFSEERIKKMTGKNHWNWIEDRTKVKIYIDRRGDTLNKQWTLDVYRRDKWKCRIADENCKGRIEAHHILSWRNHPELRYEINNGITLCHFHHPYKWKDEEKLAPLLSRLAHKEYSLK